ASRAAPSRSRRCNVQSWMMTAEPSRCEIHGTVRTSAGACLLCARRSVRSGSVLPWTIAFVVGAVVTSAFVFRVYVAISEHRSAPAATSGATGAPPGTDDTRLLAEAEREVVIDFYGAKWCPACKKARAWLDANGIAYAYHDTDQASNKPELRRLNPRGSIPT